MDMIGCSLVVSEYLCASVCVFACLSVCACVCERQSDKEVNRERVGLSSCLQGRFVSIHMLVCVCVCKRVCVSVCRCASDGMRRMGGVALHTLRCSARSLPLCHSPAPARLLSWRWGLFTPKHRPSRPSPHSSYTSIHVHSLCLPLPGLHPQC